MIMGQSDRTTEYQIGQAVLLYLASAAEGVATISEIKAYLSATYPFTPADRECSPTRPREERWEQQVRNLMCHRWSSGNAICDGLLAHSPKSLAITRLGRDYVKQRYGDQRLDIDGIE